MHLGLWSHGTFIEQNDRQTDVKILPFHNFVGRSKITSQLENEFYCIKHWWGLYEQNNIVTSFHVDDWTAEWVMMKLKIAVAIVQKIFLLHKFAPAWSVSSWSGHGRQGSTFPSADLYQLISQSTHAVSFHSEPVKHKSTANMEMQVSA